MSDPILYIDRDIAASWQNIASTRESANRFLTSQCLAEDTIEAMSMVINELIENAIKYGSYIGKTGVSTIDLTIEVLPKKISVLVSNPVASNSPYIHNLTKTVSSINEFDNAFEAYVNRIKLISEDKLINGLGLARIAYEGECELSAIVDNDNVTLSAIHNH
ncbi:hypothetical protein A9Q99_00080 [Gammaproteobacteria bacterium 45_16_T64]|nr:hypothetical protein A9Q99_00080 [Gammaproteobacteria bacterium 45_16_T64]